MLPAVGCWMNWRMIIRSRSGIVNLLALDMDAYAEKYGAKAVRKNITIPAFMNTFVERKHLSLSKITQDALAHLMLVEA